MSKVLNIEGKVEFMFLLKEGGKSEEDKGMPCLEVTSG
jgi:hypothetical protein